MLCSPFIQCRCEVLVRNSTPDCAGGKFRAGDSRTKHVRQQHRRIWPYAIHCIAAASLCKPLIFNASCDLVCCFTGNDDVVDIMDFGILDPVEPNDVQRFCIQALDLHAVYADQLILLLLLCTLG